MYFLTDQEKKDLIQFYRVYDMRIFRRVVHIMDIYESIIENRHFYTLQDEQGTFYGYKILWLDSGNFYSPVYPIKWERDGSLQVEESLLESSKEGIYSTKMILHPDLIEYSSYYNENQTAPNHRQNREPYTYDLVLVKLAISGTVIEGEIGFRSSVAQIIGVNFLFRKEESHEYWYTPEEAQERSKYYSSPSKERFWTCWERENPFYSSNPYTTSDS